MAKFARKWKVFLVHLFGILLLFSHSDGKRTKNKIYVDLQTQNACFRSLNATHQIGCSSSSEGSVGILHYLETAEDYDWVLSDGPNPPYVVLMNSIEFNSTNVDRLVDSGRVNGILVISVLDNDTLSPIPSHFSADKTCPNDGYGMYHGNSNYSSCQRQQWNVAGTATGMLFKDYGMPMFSLPNSTDVNKLIHTRKMLINPPRKTYSSIDLKPLQCYEKFNRPINGTARSYPLCAVQMKGWMIGAKDSETCMRRSSRITNLSNQVSYCDPLGDKNIVASLKTVNATTSTDSRPNNSVIVLATKMDSFSMFYNEYPSADATVTGIVTLLAVAEALGKVQQNIQNISQSKDILFTLFQGESFGYIGSSRMVYDMMKSDPWFPDKDKRDVHVQNIKLKDIHSFVELGQVGLRDSGKLWIHTDPVTRPKLKEPAVLTDLIRLLKSTGSVEGVDIDEVPVDVPLPPASVQRFLMERTIPSVVITDHEKEYTNKYYNSRFDLPGTINVSDHHNKSDVEPGTQTKALTDLATTLAHVLYKMATGENATDALKANETIVDTLLQCFLYNQVCELFRQSVHPDDEKNLEEAKKPFPFYVSVPKSTNQVTILTHSIISQYLGQEVSLTKDECKDYHYLYIQGNVNPDDTSKRQGACIKSTAKLTTAKSPAFDMDDYDMSSGKYSTWTESVWDPLKVRIFLVPSQQFQVLTLCVGVAILLVSMIVIYFINGSADVIFNTGSNQAAQS